MPATRRIGEAESLSRTVLVLLAMALSSLPVGTRKLSGQDTIPVPDSSVVEDASGGLPIFLTLGMGYGQRSDPCTNCPSPDDTDSFTGHLSLGCYLGYGLESESMRVCGSVGTRGPRLRPIVPAFKRPRRCQTCWETHRSPSPTAVLERDAKHEYLELGMGITLR